ncbi:hypothetical protein L3073_12905 [Ancylomarina sp. DW003]|nr:hypothetical protein [Ancylomarina sp. DW003]MDE5423111.1 hypothetical protein [Ancylomarina sp. DW003]
MKAIRFKHLLILICLSLSLGAGCDKVKPDCGCDSETLNVISESDNLIGQIWYKTKQDLNDDYYNNKYWISVIVKNSDKADHFIICNEEFINDEIIKLAKTSEDTKVKFTGHLKETCKKEFDVSERTYSRIVLTKIELQ